MAFLEAEEEKRIWKFQRPQLSMALQYTTIIAENGILRIQMDGIPTEKGGGIIELSMMDIQEIYCAPNFSLKYFLLIGTAAALSIASWNMLTSYQGWRAGTMHTILTSLGFILFGIGTVIIAMRYSRLTIKHAKGSIEVEILDPILGMSNAGGLMEYVKQHSKARDGQGW